jgi:hypothetical protein
MTGLQIMAAVGIWAAIGIVFAALLWPEPHENEHPDHRAALSATASPAIPAAPARRHRGTGRTRLARTLLENFRATAQRHARRYQA